MTEIEIHGETLHLDHRRALVWPRQRAVLDEALGTRSLKGQPHAEQDNLPPAGRADTRAARREMGRTCSCKIEFARPW